MRGPLHPSAVDAGSRTVERRSVCVAVEYAVGLVAAAAFAGLLIVIIDSGGVLDALTGLIERALAPAAG